MDRFSYLPLFFDKFIGAVVLLRQLKASSNFLPIKTRLQKSSSAGKDGVKIKVRRYIAGNIIRFFKSRNFFGVAKERKKTYSRDNCMYFTRETISCIEHIFSLTISLVKFIFIGLIWPDLTSDLILWWGLMVKLKFIIKVNACVCGGGGGLNWESNAEMWRNRNVIRSKAYFVMELCWHFWGTNLNWTLIHHFCFRNLIDQIMSYWVARFFARVRNDNFFVSIVDTIDLKIDLLI